jgi:NTP pyrophosphatase (non-canonical NTP hydrolase)
MEDLIKKIEQWAEDRNIINGTKPIDQAMKLFSEFGELADNIGKGRDCRDDVGDVFVVLTILSAQSDGNLHKVTDYDEPYELLSKKEEVYYLGKNLIDIADLLITYTEKQDIDFVHAVLSLKAICELSGYTLEECVQIAYDDIKDRKGKVVNGVFIKESDLKDGE